MSFFDFSAPLFWYKLVFITELIIAEGLATYTFKKRSHFVWRVVISAFALYAFAFVFPLFFVSDVVNEISNSVMFLSFFMASVGLLKFIYDEKFITLFFCGVISYTTQHLAYSTSDFLIGVTGVSSFNIYGNMQITAEHNYLFMALFYAISYVVVYWFVWAFVEHKIREQDKLYIEPILIISFTTILAVDVIVSSIATYAFKDISISGRIVLYAYKLSACLLVFVVLYNTLKKHQAQNELEKVELLWAEDKKRYEQSKKNIELINIKCHDLKHQIRKLKGVPSDQIDDNYLKELERSINIYDNSVRTGNETLDLILAENSIQMINNKIKFSVIADGSKLSFMHKSDIYSLFGNAISNAIEAMTSIDETQRVLKLKVQTQGKMLMIHVENPCKEISFDHDGLPLTKKNSKDHGYGMRSMKLISEKYGGNLNCYTENDIFYLDILMPIPDDGELKTAF